MNEQIQIDQDQTGMSLETKLIFRISDTIKYLAKLWNEVSMDQKARDVRIDCVYLHFFTLLDDIIKSEENMVRGVKSDIEAFRLTIFDLRKFFNMSTFNEAVYPENSIELLKALEADYNILIKKKDNIIDKQLEEYESLKEVCLKLDIVPNFDSNKIKTEILSPGSFKKLNTERNEVNIEIKKRLKHISKLQSHCRVMYKTLKETISCTSEQQNLLNTDFSTLSIPLTDKIIEKFEKLHFFINESYNNWLEQTTFYYSEILILYKDLCEKCCIEHSVISYPKFFDPALHDQSIIDKLEIEIKQLKARYKIGSKIFESFCNWKNLWQEKINREKEASCSHFYNNRRCQLNAFLKRQRQLISLVPQSLRELKGLVNCFRKNGGNLNDILIKEKLPDDYAEYLMSEYKEQQSIHRKVQAADSNNTFVHKGNRKSFKVKVTSGKIARRRLSISHHDKLSYISPTKTPIMRELKTSVFKKISANQTPKTGIPFSEFSCSTTILPAMRFKSRLPRKVPTSMSRLIFESPFNNQFKTPTRTSKTINANFNTEKASTLKINVESNSRTPVSHWRY